jgi:hypothetical protein
METEKQETSMDGQRELGRMTAYIVRRGSADVAAKDHVQTDLRMYVAQSKHIFRQEQSGGGRTATICSDVNVAVVI